MAQELVIRTDGGTGSSPLTLTEIIRRNVAIEWPEGVALVRAVIGQLQVGSDSTLIPELYDIQISSAGAVELLGGRQSGEPVRRLGQLLQATLGRAEPPMQVKLMISQATAPQPGFGSVAEFDEVLGYYERPNRDAIIRALYDRAAAAQPTDSSPVSAPTLDAIAPLPTDTPIKKPKAPPKPPEVRRRQRKTALAATLLLAIVGAGAYYLRSADLRAEEDGSDGGPVTTLAAKATETVGAAVMSGLSAVTETVGLGRLVTGNGSDASPAPPAAPPVAPASTSTASSGAARRRPAQLTPPRLPVAVFDLGPRAAVVPNAVAVEDAPVEAPAVTPGIETNGSTYSEANADVVPPVGIRPQLPRELPPDVRLEELARVELLVLEDGTVETVRLVSSPRTVHDSMFLSAIKAWEFQPALKDGKPVRYIKTVWIAHR